MIDSWIHSVKNDKTRQQNVKPQPDKGIIDLTLNEDNKFLDIVFKCPLPPEARINKSVCEITHGLFHGLGNLIGLSNATLLETEIRNNSNACRLRMFL